jgi:16S rRNA (adenine1518-N6/adenine1519-N6)-dimethyltransferase
MNDTPLNLPPLNVPSLLRQHGLRPHKGLGQNFLVDEAALARIVEAAEIPPSACVLEIGSGPGGLTRRLALAARRVVAVEIDAGLVSILRQVVADFPNVFIYQGDILEVSPTQLLEDAGVGQEDEYLVVANIPYYITSLLIRRLLETQRKPSRLVLTVQQEVVERICAAPGNMSLLSLSVQVYGEPERVARIPAGAFYPPPKVDSAVLRVRLHSQPRIPTESLDAFFQLAKAGFSQKRKTLRNALAGGLRMDPAATAALLETAGVDPLRRAQTLDFKEWGCLTRAYLDLYNEAKT